MRPLDLAGQRFGSLTAIRPTDERPNKGVGWLCRCDCGKEIIVPASTLRSGRRVGCQSSHNTIVVKEPKNDHE